ncbi:MAG: hypothetical protein OXG38_02305 [Chloroflexi bacterium]|nr:hypothetical protein [Chloroflexota bacterium]
MPDATAADHIDRLDPLAFRELRRANVQRCRGSYHDPHDWSPSDWATAMAGELGEVCDLIKRERRGEAVSLHAVGAELADLVTYADLLAHRMGIDLGAAIREKFDVVSHRVGSSVRLGEVG